MAEIPQAAEPRAVPGPRPRPWLVLAVVLAAAFMQLVDVSIVNVAVNSLRSELNASYAQVQWVLAGYTLAFAVLLVAGGKLGDRVGRKRMFVSGVLAFTAASLLCGVAVNAEMLVAARLFQGLAAALMYPQVYSVIQVTFPPERRGTAFGILGGVTGLAAITGPLVGGLLIQADLFGWAWRPIFLVNVPVGLLTAAFAAYLIPESRASEAGRLDATGVVLVTAGLTLLVYPMIQGRELDWPAWAFVMMGSGALVLLLFGAHERRRTEKGREPLIRMALFRNRAFTCGLLLIVLFYGAFLPFFLVFSVYVQAGLGYTAMQAGIALVPYALGAGAGSGVSIALAPRMGRRVLQTGLVILILGTLAVAWVVHRWGTELRSPQLIAPLVVAGLGFGLTVTPLVTLILAKVDQPSVGSASGALTTAQQVGNALGVAVIGALFFGLLGSQAEATTRDQQPQLRAELAAAHVEAPQADRLLRRYRDCFSDRMNAKDTSATPASCRAARGGRADEQAARVLTDAARHAVRTDFARSTERTLLVQAALFLVCLLLVFTLPKVRGPEFSEFEEKSQDTVILG